MAGFTLNELPRTFVDACYLTARLGYKFVWIDALCILQDSREDWAVESLKMGDVFQGAQVVLAAHSARDASKGFLERTLRLPTTVSLPTKPALALRLRQNFETDVARSHLSRRGWVMQERLLATRTLHFTEGHIFLESPRDIWAEGDLTTPEVRYRSPNLIYGRIVQEASRFLHPAAFPNTTASPEPGQRDQWANLIEWYSTCELTREEDKLIAISGIANVIRRNRGGLYYAGLWSDSFHAGLLWLRQAEELTFPDKWRAPSWSWASIDGPLQYLREGQAAIQPACQIVALDNEAFESPGCQNWVDPSSGSEPLAEWHQNPAYVTIDTETVDITEWLKEDNPRNRKALWLWPRSNTNSQTDLSMLMPDLQYPVPVFPILRHRQGVRGRYDRPLDGTFGWVALDNHKSRGEGEGDVENTLRNWDREVLFVRIARKASHIALGLVLALCNKGYVRIGFGQLDEERFCWESSRVKIA
jgi:hypothetical protein